MNKLAEKWAEGFESVCQANGVDPEALVKFAQEGDAAATVTEAGKDPLQKLIADHIARLTKLRDPAELAKFNINRVLKQVPFRGITGALAAPMITTPIGLLAGGVHGLVSETDEDETRMQRLGKSLRKGFRYGAGAGLIGGGALGIRSGLRSKYSPEAVEEMIKALQEYGNSKQGT